MRPRYSMEIYDRGVGLRLNVRMVKAEATETLLCGCVTWSPSKAHYDNLRPVHHSCSLSKPRQHRLEEKEAQPPHSDALVNTATQAPRALRRRYADGGCS